MHLPSHRFALSSPLSPGVLHLLDSLIHDLRYGLRSLGRTPGLTTIAILSLTLGIGANSAIFTMVNATMFPTLPYVDSDRLVDLHEDSPQLCAGCGVGTSFPTFIDWRERTRSHARMGAYLEDGFALSGDARPERVSGSLVSAELFPLLGVRPVLGRHIAFDEDRVGAPGVVLLSHELWVRRYGSDSTVVGRMIAVSGEPHTVVGVMPPRFKFPERAQLWLPITPRLTSAARDDRSVGVIARLRPGITLDGARAELAQVGSDLAREHADAYRGWSPGLTTLREDLTSDSGPPFVMLLGASGFVLLIACANLANLLLARATRRSREYAVRAALGAGRRRLVQQLLLESLLLSAGGAALGVLVALWGADAARGLLPDEVPFWIQFDVDGRVIAFTAALAVLTGVMFGLTPALRAARTDVQEALRDGSRGGTTGVQRGRLRSALVIGEVALSLMLLAGAGLLIKTFVNARRTSDFGYDPRGVLTASAELVDRRYAEQSQQALFASSVLTGLEGAADVELAAVERTEFLGTFVGTSSRVTLEGATGPVPDEIVPRFARAVSPDYFELLRIPVSRGRGFAESDGPGAPAVAVVSRGAADALWPGQDALGKRLRLGGDGNAPWITVVGVTQHVRGSPLSRRPGSFIYLPIAQSPGQPVTILVRTRGEPLVFVPALEALVARVDPNQPLTNVESMEQSLASYLTPVTFFLRLMGGMAALAVVLAAIGIYGVLSYVVSMRTHEIGIRVALGAGSGRVARLILSHGLVLAGIGIALGLVGALAVTRVLRGILFGVSPTDPVVLSAVTVVLMGVSLAACWVPARRALRVNPMEALRNE
jgi:putative ABC transport system permease protein